MSPSTERIVRRRIGAEVSVRRGVATPDRLVAGLAAKQWGVVSLSQLRGCGLTKDRIAVRVRHGQIHRLHQGVYAVGHPCVPREGRFLAAVQAFGERAVLSHFSAAALWQLVDWDDWRVPEVTVLQDGVPRRSGIRAHCSIALPRLDISNREGIPVTSPARTVVDLAAQLDYRELRRAVRQAQSLRVVEIGELAEVMQRLGPRRGVRNLRRILASGPAPTRSVLEDVVLDLILSAGFAPPDVNVPLVLAGRRVIPDFRWAECRLVLEADGAAWHGHRLAREDDAERQALLDSHGERVLRVTWGQAVSHPGQVIERLRAAGAPEAPSSG